MRAGAAVSPAHREHPSLLDVRGRGEEHQHGGGAGELLVHRSRHLDDLLPLCSLALAPHVQYCCVMLLIPSLFLLLHGSGESQGHRHQLLHQVHLISVCHVAA